MQPKLLLTFYTVCEYLEDMFWTLYFLIKLLPPKAYNKVMIQFHALGWRLGAVTSLARSRRWRTHLLHSKASCVPSKMSPTDLMVMDAWDKGSWYFPVSHDERLGICTSIKVLCSPVYFRWSSRARYWKTICLLLFFKSSCSFVEFWSSSLIL